MTVHTLSKQGQQNYARGKVNNVSTDSAQEVPDIVISTFLVNSHFASVLFDSGASHSFISAHFHEETHYAHARFEEYHAC
jgi:hypothetical protein